MKMHDLVSGRLKEYAALTEQKLTAAVVISGKEQKAVADAMAYSLEAGGKRIRPALALAFCRLFSGEEKAALSYAAAVEMIHTYSLIHDDLPCMDNDDLRRGKPSCHIAFGESTALLAGDGLLTLAFETAAAAPLSPEQNCAALLALARAAGADGMIGGQVIDLALEGKAATRAELIHMCALKTGALLRVSAELGCIAARADEVQTTAAKKYADALGLAFQIVDDILDVTGTAEALGKPIGSDAENSKNTFVTLLGLDGARQAADTLAAEAKAALENLEGDTEFLYALVDYLSARNH